MILDRDLLRITPDKAMTAAIEAGVHFFQYRNKNGSRREIFHACADLSRIARASRALFIVNDHADIASAVEADGVHLGQEDLPIEIARKLVGRDRIIGVSTHNREQAVIAERAGADYVGYGPIFETKTKENAETSKGISSLRLIKHSVSLPVIAIGGINHSNIQDVAASGADGVAVISAVLSAPDFKAAAAEMVRLSQAAFRSERVPGGLLRG